MRVLPLRTVLFLTAVAALVLLYLLWWTTYAGIHFQARFAQQPAGAAAEVGGTSIRVVSLRQSRMLADQKYSGIPEQASVRDDLGDRRARGGAAAGCSGLLLHPGAGRSRHPALGEAVQVQPNTARRATPRRSSQVSSVRFEAIFLVPQQFADQLMGVALMDPSVADRVPVITPPA